MNKMWKIISAIGMFFSIVFLFVSVVTKNYIFGAAIWAWAFYIFHNLFTTPDEDKKDNVS